MTTHMITTDAPSTVDGRREVPERAGRKQWIALVVLMLPVLLVSVDNTVLNVALPPALQGSI